MSEDVETASKCRCWKCGGNVLGEYKGIKMVGLTVCPACGSKRCPKANDHDLPCSETAP